MVTIYMLTAYFVLSATERGMLKSTAIIVAVSNFLLLEF